MSHEWVFMAFIVGFATGWLGCMATLLALRVHDKKKRHKPR